MTITVGTLLADRFEVVRPLQSGGMGSVFEARDQHSRGLRCAIKKMLEHLTEGEMAEVYRARFAAETNFLKQLCHPGIPRLLDSFVLDGAYYIAMEFVPGRNLAQELEERMQLTGTTVSVEQLLRDVSQVLDILHYLHNQSPPLVHRDIKPANLIREHPSGRIKLVDFGLARSLAGDKNTQTQIGTLGYSPLEQLQGRSEPRSDLYALGVTMHELLSGQPPVPLSIPPIGKLRPDLEPQLAQLVDKACAARPEDRFESAQDMLDTIRQLKPAQPRALPLEIEPPVAVHAFQTREFEQAPPTRLMEGRAASPPPPASPEAPTGGLTAPAPPAPPSPTGPLPGEEDRVSPRAHPFPMALVGAVGIALMLGLMARHLLAGSSGPPPPSPSPPLQASASVAPPASPLPEPSPTVATPAPPPVSAETPVFAQPFYRKPRRPQPAATAVAVRPPQPGETFSLGSPKYPVRRLNDLPKPPRDRRSEPPSSFVPSAQGLPEPTVSLPEEWSRTTRTSNPTRATMTFVKPELSLNLKVTTETMNDPAYMVRHSFGARRSGWNERKDVPGADLAYERNTLTRRAVDVLIMRPGHYYVLQVQTDRRIDEEKFRGEVAAALHCIDVP